MQLCERTKYATFQGGREKIFLLSYFGKDVKETVEFFADLSLAVRDIFNHANIVFYV